MILGRKKRIVEVLLRRSASDPWVDDRALVRGRAAVAPNLASAVSKQAASTRQPRLYRSRLSPEVARLSRQPATSTTRTSRSACDSLQRPDRYLSPSQAPAAIFSSASAWLPRPRLHTQHFGDASDAYSPSLAHSLPAPARST